MDSQTLVKEICPATTQKWIKKGALLVDVREEDEVKELAYDAPNLIYIPLSEFEERWNEIPKNKNVIMVCSAGSRSLRAAGFLVNQGYPNVVNMRHGIQRWVQKGFPTTANRLSVTEHGSCSSGSNCC